MSTPRGRPPRWLAGRASNLLPPGREGTLHGISSRQKVTPCRWQSADARRPHELAPRTPALVPLQDGANGLRGSAALRGRAAHTGLGSRVALLAACLRYSAIRQENGANVQSLPVVLLGFLLGMLHATDADHVVAVSNIVVRQRSVGSAARVGFFWGLGHTFTVFAVGSAIILFNLAISARLEQAMEFCVALMLVLLGVVTLSRVRRQVHDVVTPRLAEGASVAAADGPGSGALLHLHTSGGGAYVHAHGSSHGPAGEHGWLDRLLGGILRYPALRPLGIGVIHGLAGPPPWPCWCWPRFANRPGPVAYLLLFGVGTTAGMMLVTLGDRRTRSFDARPAAPARLRHAGPGRCAEPGPGLLPGIRLG